MRTAQKQEQLAKRREHLKEYLSRVKYAAVSELWDSLPTDDKHMTANGLRSYLNLLVQAGVLKTSAVKNRIRVYYNADTPEPDLTAHPALPKNFTQGSYSRNSRLRDYYSR